MLALTVAGSACSATVPSDASATWATLAGLESGSLTTATFGRSFLPVDGGTGGVSYASASLLSPTVAYVDLRNDSSVRATLTGTIVGRSAVSLLGMSVTVDSCTVAWRRQDGTCPGTRTRQLVDDSLASPTPLTWATLAPGASARLKLTVGGGVGIVVTLLATADAVPARSGADRTES